MCELWRIVADIFYLYILVMLVYAVLSWIPSIRGRWTQYVAMLVEPVLVPVRRVIPPLGGIDLSFLVVLIVLEVILRMIIAPQIASACSLYY